LLCHSFCSLASDPAAIAMRVLISEADRPSFVI